jgi:protein SCO1/2
VRTPGPSRWAAALFATAVALAPAALRAQAPDRAPALDLDKALERSQRAIGERLGDHELTDADGRRVRLSAYRGKPLVVSFIYTGCSQVCPTTTKFLADAVRKAESALGKGSFRVVSVGFNLPYDHPGAMKAFSRQMGIDSPNWAFLSPDAATLAAMVRETGFGYAPASGGFDHLTQVTIVDAEGRVVRQVYGESFELPMLVGPLKDLVAGAPLERASVSGLVQKVRILCTVYDPRTGNYRLDYGLLFEIVTGASVLLFTLHFLLREWWRQRRPRHG